MPKNTRKKLIALGPEILADNLLELTEFSEEAYELVARLTATPQEKASRFKASAIAFE